MKVGAGRTQGFTLVELMTTLIILGILAAVAMPRFFDRRAYDARTFLDQTASLLRYAQKAAIAQRRTVCAGFTANTVSLTIDADANANNGCETGLTGPGGTAPYTVTASGSVTFSPTPAAFSFSAEGRPSSGMTIAIAGAASSLIVEAETGYVRY